MQPSDYAMMIVTGTVVFLLAWGFCWYMGARAKRKEDMEKQLVEMKKSLNIMVEAISIQSEAERLQSQFGWGVGVLQKINREELRKHYPDADTIPVALQDEIRRRQVCADLLRIEDTQ